MGLFVIIPPVLAHRLILIMHTRLIPLYYRSLQIQVRQMQILMNFDGRSSPKNAVSPWDKYHIVILKSIHLVPQSISFKVTLLMKGGMLIL